MNRLLLLVCLVLLCAAAAAPRACAAPFAPRAEILRAWDAFAAERPGALVAWDEETGGVRSILLPRPAPSARDAAREADAAERIARDFLDTNAALLGLAGVDLLLERTRADGRVVDLRFVQSLGGLPVEGSEVLVNVAADGVLMVALGLEPRAVGSAPPAPARLSADDAREAAMRACRVESLRGEVRVDPVVALADGSPVSACRVRIPARAPLADFECLVDAATGAVLSVADRLDQAGATGVAYPSNPLKGAAERVTLENLLDPGALVGKFAKIYNDDAPAAQPVGGAFDFELSDTHFDEVCAYFYTDRAHAYYKERFGFADLDRMQRVHVHFGDALDNAYYSRWDQTILLGDGDRWNDLAREEAVLWHEYGHAVTYAICSLNVGEAGAMNEAFSDYFACSMSNDPEIGEWVTAKAGEPYLRRIANDARYPRDYADQVHHDSLIYSGALWDLRGAVGARDCDELVHFSRKHLVSVRSTFADGLRATLAVDRERFGGRHAGAIREAFGRHGIESAQPQSARAWRDLLAARAFGGDAAARARLAELQNDME